MWRRRSRAIARSVLVIAGALTLSPLTAPAGAGHVAEATPELGSTIQLGLFNQGLVPGGSGLDVPLGSSAPAPPRAEASAATGDPPPPRVYVIVVDGLNPQEVGPLTPTLSALRDGGTWYEQARAVLPGETLPNHAAMMTGVPPARNGIIANQFWRGPSAQSAVEYMQYPEFLDADTLTTRLETSYDGTISTATVLSKEYLYGLFLGEQAGATLPQREADFHWDPRSQPLFVIKPSDHAADVATMDAFLGWVKSQSDSSLPQFGFANLGDVDRAGHADEEGVVTAAADRATHPGEDELSGDHISPFRQAAIENADSQLGRLIDELKQTDAWDESVLIVLSDHGMDWGPQNQYIRAVDRLIAEGYKGGDRTPNPGTHDFHVVGGGGSELIYVHHESDVADMSRILCDVDGVALVATRNPVTDLPAERCQGATLAEMGIDHPRSPDIELFTEPGWHSSPQAGPFAGGVNPLPGNHGHTITQHSTLMVAGGHPLLRDQPTSVPGERVYERDSFAPPAGGPGVLSVAPTVAALFGIGEPAGGYSVAPLTAAFDPGVLDARGLAAPADSSTRPRPRDSVGTTLTADRAKVDYGERFTLSGQISGAPVCGRSHRVALYKFPAGARPHSDVVATSIAVRADGAWAQALRSRPSAVYRAEVQPTESCEGSLSQPVSVPVHARVEIAQTCTKGAVVRGRVLPRAPRTTVVMKRIRRGADRRVGRDRLDGASRFAFRPSECNGRYRVLWPSRGETNERGAATFRARGRR